MSTHTSTHMSIHKSIHKSIHTSTHMSTYRFCHMVVVRLPGAEAGCLVYSPVLGPESWVD